jgi:hypothetical protein
MAYIYTMPKRVKEPVQVYLDKSDRALLDRLAEEQGLSRAEVLRRGIRQLAVDQARGPLHYLVGIIDDPSGPTDMSVNHDKYLAEADDEEIARWHQS